MSNCKKCSKNGISVLQRLAYSAGGRMRCRFCGASHRVNRILGVIYLLFEATGIFVAAIFAVVSLNVWLFVFIVLAAAVLRVFLLPQFARMEVLEGPLGRRQRRSKSKAASSHQAD